ncbi:hypothetical protein [Nocardia phage P3.1]|nr:hypothetical protein [Nocardia phage P3.1]
MWVKIQNRYVNKSGNQITTHMQVSPPTMDKTLAALMEQAKALAQKFAQYSDTQLDIHPDQGLYGCEITLGGIAVKGAPPVVEEASEAVNSG